ncbi:MAG: macrolide transporter subunit MacA [Rhodocyclales bacterium]|nr:macrolide transporter subunit MacA [Rhodocyclales bacterium]
MPKISARNALIAAMTLVALGVGAVAMQTILQDVEGEAFLTAKVVRTDLVRSVMTTGSLQAQQQVDVGAQVSGQVKALKVQLGERVQKGQLLAEIDPVLPENALRSAKANLESLEAQRRAVAASLRQADLAHRRQQAMIAQDATSRQELEAANAQLQALHASLASYDAQISQARTQVDTAKANVEYTRITAPMDGEVVGIVTKQGQTVVASQQAPVILKLANLDTMTVEAEISEADVIRIRAGQVVYFTILGDSTKRYYSKLRAVEPSPQEFQTSKGAKTNTSSGPVFYNALFDVPNPDHHLRIGMTAQVTVVLREAKNALSVPLTALGKRTADGRNPVRVLRKNGNIETVTIAVGVTDRVNVEVLDGLQEGDEVVIEEGAESSAGAS